MTLIIDVSSNNGPIDFAAVRKAGAKGVIAKATEGTSYVNPLYRQQTAAARRAGMYVGAYHFARPDRNGARDEANHYCATVGQLGPLDMKPALDYEWPCRLPDVLQAKWIRDFNQIVRDELGQWPFFYSYTAYINALHLTAPVGNGLWLANYGKNDGVRHPVPPPAPWQKIHLHQFTSNGRVGPYKGDVSWAPSMSALLAFPARARLAKAKALL